MPASPWKTVGPVDPGREHLVLLSFLPLKRLNDPTRGEKWIRSNRSLEQTHPGSNLDLRYSTAHRPRAR